MKLKITIASFLFAFSFTSINAQTQSIFNDTKHESNGATLADELKTKSGKILPISYGLSYGDNFISYGYGTYSNGVLRTKKITLDTLKWATYSGKVYLSWFQGEVRKYKSYVFVELVAQNDKYKLLRGVYQEPSYPTNYYILDNNNKNVLGGEKDYVGGKSFEVKTFKPGSEKWKVSNQNAIVSFQNYFTDCPELIDALKKNLSEGIQLTDNLPYFPCKGAPDLKTFLDNY